MKIINKLVLKITNKRLIQIDFFKENPYEVQNKTLKELIGLGKATEFGVNHNFNLINGDYNNFVKNIPIRNYDELKPYIERMMKGEKNVLWQDSVKWFAQSSGTTSDKSKFIPISKESMELCHFRGGKDVIIMNLNLFPDSKFLFGKTLGIGGSKKISNFNNELFFGDLSALLIDNMPIWINILRTPEKSVALMSEWEEKIDKMAKITSKTNVTNIAGVPSWTLVLMKKILEITGKSDISEIWPNLELFVHGGVSFIPYRNEFKKIISSPGMKYMETYNASEGFFGIQDDFSTDDMLLMLDYGIFYEFVPFENINDENPVAYPLESVELNKNYAMIITTNGGLWRYMIGDTVKFTSKNPYKIKITGRTKHYINAFGEELIIDNAEKALKIACEKTGALIKEYTAAPVFMNQNSTGAHEWLIEFSKKPENIILFTEILDTALKSLNSDYEAKRYKNLNLQMPIVNIAEEGVFYNWLKEKGKLGGQNKIPRLSNDRSYINELLKK
jgi:hypothetical protein